MTAFQGVSCLVTGGAGFIGSHVAARLVAAGAKVTILDDLSSGHEHNLLELRPHAEFVCGDIRDAAMLDRLLPGVELVFHLAALPSVVYSVEHPVESLSVNWQGTLALAEAARRHGARRLIFSSSCAVYGPRASGALSEDRRPDPASPYATAKIGAEYLLSNFHTLYGFETVCLRYFNVFGPRQDPDSPYGAVIPLFVKALLDRRQPVIFGDGNQTRDFVPVEQVAWTNLQAAACPPGTIVNVGNGRQTNLWEILRVLGDALGVVPEPRLEPERAGDIRESLADITRNRAVFGTFDGPDLPEMLARTALWFAGRLPEHRFVD
jgi:UDP-glucose 4-epimerase